MKQDTMFEWLNKECMKKFKKVIGEIKENQVKPKHKEKKIMLRNRECKNCKNKFYYCDCFECKVDVKNCTHCWESKPENW